MHIILSDKNEVNNKNLVLRDIRGAGTIATSIYDTISEEYFWSLYCDTACDFLVFHKYLALLRQKKLIERHNNTTISYGKVYDYLLDFMIVISFKDMPIFDSIIEDWVICEKAFGDWKKLVKSENSTMSQRFDACEHYHYTRDVLAVNFCNVLFENKTLVPAKHYKVLDEVQTLIKWHLNKEQQLDNITPYLINKNIIHELESI